jgi:2-succinyl-5-enolpyruvyl-6-hydroxy-3-cyclohexene-1-carboxylate synthase
VEWYTAPRDGLSVFSNRGANGIDGVTSTAIGVALSTKAPTALLIGDVAFLHDSAALIALVRRDIDLTLVIVDNDGGGIFSFLPQATAVESSRFEQLYGTPHGTNISALLAAHGISSVVVESAGELAAAVNDPSVQAVIVSTDRAHNVVVHQVIHAAVQRALRPA